MRRAPLSLSPLVSLLLLLLYTKSSHRISIIDREIEEYTHNIYTVTFHDYSIQTMVTRSHSLANNWLTSCSSELRDVGSSRNSGLHIIGLDIGWFPNLHDQDNPIVVDQLLDIIVDSNPDKDVGAVAEEVDEGLGDARLMLK